MRAGRLEQIAEPDALLQAPATPYVRDLVHAGDPVYRSYYLHARALVRDGA
jgi:ABC-type proline/glycine betaine transport system ATPase subunit